MDDSTSDRDERLARAFRLVVAYCRTPDPGPEDAFLARHPELRHLLTPMLEQGRTLLRGEATPSSPEGVSSGPGLPHIGPYRLERELGRGGHAVVYLAVDRRLRRKVALKMLTDVGLQSPAMRMRLRREAEAAAKLDHPGICHVHEIGEENGVPYIAMRYVEGRTLSEILAEARAADARDDTGSFLCEFEDRDREPGPRRSDPGARSRVPGTPEAIHETASLIERLARALHLAHEAGLVHRDIKPRNIMVTPSGEPVLVDFGIAHDQASDAGALTQTGQLVGTPAYLAPEQLSVRPVQVDRRADVYALGVTLYECLTLRLPFEMPTREQLYQKILVAEPPDPRRFNPAITHDMKAILETALEKDRDRRYRTALDLAEDLRRFRELEPVRARPAGSVLKLRRWAQRNRALAAALTGVFLALAGGLVVSFLLLADSGRERKRAEVNFAMAMDSVEQMLTEVGLSEESLASLPDLDETRRNLLERALSFYRRFLQQRRDDPRVRREAALAHHRVAHFRFLLGELAEAREENSRAIARCRELLDEAPGDAGIRQDLVRFSREQASILSASGKYEEATEVLERSLAVARNLLALAPDRHDVAGLLAECETELGELRACTGDTDGAESTLRQAVDRLDRLVAANPEVPSYRFLLAEACRHLAQVVRLTDPAGQAAPLERCRSLLDALVKQHPHTSCYALARAVTLLSLGLFEMASDHLKADSLLAEAIHSLELLSARHPEQWAIRLRLASGQLFRAQILFDEGRPAESEAVLEKAKNLAQGLDVGIAGLPARARQLIDTYRSLAQCLQESRRPDEARQYDEKALALAEAHATGPDDLSMLWTLAGIYSASGFRLAESGRPADAEHRIRKAIEIQEKLTAVRPGWIGLQDDHAMALNKLASLYYHSERWADAEALFGRSLAIRRELARRCPESAYIQSRLGATLHNVAAQHLRRSEREEARKLLEEAVATQLEALRIAPRLLAARRFLYEHLRYLGRVLLDLGRYEGAAKAAEELAHHLPDAPGARFESATLLAGAAALTDEGAERSERYAERAVHHLAKAVAHGFNEVERVREQAWFQRLEEREDYRHVLEQLAEGQ